MSIPEEIELDDIALARNTLNRLKDERQDLIKQLNSLNQPIHSSIISAFFSSSEEQNIERLKKEESELKASLQKVAGQINEFKQQMEDVDRTIIDSDHISVIEALFQSKKRELTRLKSLNEAALNDLGEEVELARSLCESLESGKSSFSRDKEVIDGSIASLQSARATIEQRIADVTKLNEQLREELRVKSGEHLGIQSIMEEYDSLNDQYQELELEYRETCLEFDSKLNDLRIIEETKANECRAIRDEQQELMRKNEDQLKALKNELQSIGSRTIKDSKLEIDINKLVEENQSLEKKLNELKDINSMLRETSNKYQEECSYLVNWLKKETKSSGDMNKILQDLIDLEKKKRDELEEIRSKK